MAAYERLLDLDAIARLHAKDASLFTDDPAVAASVSDRLGWVGLAARSAEGLAALREIAGSAIAEGLTDVVLLGMGGSSLATLVMGDVLRPTGAALHVVDTVAPITVERLLSSLDPATTLFVVASKSGGTVEPNSLYAICRAHVGSVLPHDAADARFIAITDPGSSLESLATLEAFRAVVHAPVDIGGRFSAMSVFGLLPMALIGADLDLLVSRAAEAESSCRVDGDGNPAVELAAFAVDSAEKGADKLTVVAGNGLESFGLWVEQLVAESLGKKGEGIVPVVELSDAPHGYGTDRAIVVVRMTGDAKLAEWAASQRGRHPVHEIVLDDAYDIAEQFVVWEHAVAFCGLLLGVNPFDEPNVAEAKAATVSVLDGTAESPEPQESVDGVYLTFAGGLELPDHPERSLQTALGHAVASLREGDYLSILAFLPDDEELLAPLKGAATELSSKTGAAVCLELGPRYLHSTGQLYKGGPNTGVFVMVTTRDDTDIPIPGREWGLRALHLAQADGDLTALAAHGRRVLRLDLADASPASVSALAAAISDGVAG